MAGMIDSLNRLLQDTRSRVILIVTGVVLIGAVVIGLLAVRARTAATPAKTQLSNVPGGIQSIPGGQNPTAQYAKLVAEKNVQQAKDAEKTGKSAIPTIIRIGDKTGSESSSTGSGSVGFSTLSRADDGTQKDLGLIGLKQSNCGAAELAAARQRGATAQEIHSACSCQQLVERQYPLSALQTVCACGALRQAGVSAVQMKQIGQTASQLRVCGFSACAMKAAGYSAAQMRLAGFGNGELKGAGFSAADIRAAQGLPEGVSSAEVRSAGNQLNVLRQLRNAGVSAGALRRMNGADAKTLRAAGYSPSDLRRAGFSAAQLKQAGLSAAALRTAGYTPRQLLDAGYTPEQLKQAGVTLAQLKQAAEALPQGLSAASVKAAGCGEAALRRERLAGLSRLAAERYAHCDKAELQKIYATPLQRGLPKGMAAAEVKKAGCTASALRAERAKGVSAGVIMRYAGCSVKSLRAAGYTADQLANGGASAAQLEAAGVSAKATQAAINGASGALAALTNRGCVSSIVQRARLAGIRAVTLRDRFACSASDLKSAGYSAEAVHAGGYGAAGLKKAGYDAKQLIQAGLSPTALRQAGFSASALKSAGENAAALKQSGYSAKQLLAAGVSPKTLRQIGESAKALHRLGLSASALRQAGYTPKQMLAAGYHAKALQRAGFTAGELKRAGLSAKALHDAGFSAAALQRGGYTAQQLNAAGYPVAADERSPQANNRRSLAVSRLDGVNAGLQGVVAQQQKTLSRQKTQQDIQQLQGQMASYAGQMLQTWKPAQQFYQAGVAAQSKSAAQGGRAAGVVLQKAAGTALPVIKAGSILFAVIDTSVNSDEPGPILATIVSGRYKGAKLIGSFTLPSNSKRMVVSFSQMSLPSLPSTIGINAYAVDPNTARTALASAVDNHYLLRYGSLFASSFLDGFGSSVQAKGTTITIGSDGGSTITTDAGRSVLESAAVGLSKMGQSWGEQIAPTFNRPPTVKLFSGTGVGILFTQDVQLATH